MTVRQLALLGDSTTQGSTGSFNFTLGGLGCWADLVTERLANIQGVGPLLSSGFLGTHRNLVEWTVPGVTTTVQSTDAFDVYPYATTGTHSNGASKVWTFVKQPSFRSIVGFAIYWVNKTSGGNWQYRVDGGTWTNHNQTLGGATENKLCKFYVAQAVTSTVEIRASSDASTGVDCFPAGIEVFYLDPATTQGLIVHNLAVGGRTLNGLVASTSGDRMAILDDVQLGTGSPVDPTPNAGVISMNVNDYALDNATTWGSNLTSLNTRVSSLGTVGFINLYQASTAVYSAATQLAYRDQTKTTAAGFGTPAKVLDIYDLWSAKGITGFTAATTAGYMLDTVHESQLGHQDIANYVYWWIRTQFLNIGNVPSSYPVGGKLAAVQYSGKRAAVQYSAGAPISV